jgi:hypothetical protein
VVCDVISAVTEFMDISPCVPRILPSALCDVISAVTEFMAISPCVPRIVPSVVCDVISAMTEFMVIGLHTRMTCHGLSGVSLL